ncbi:MAG: hypothetical protein AAGC54_07005 [Cyanobacteria bacterium P01_F01_bin.4]
MGHSTKFSRETASGDSLRPLSYDDSYSCPVCAHGQLSVLVLTDAFACDFCRHIFTANLDEQSVQVIDSAQPMAWRWTGKQWRSAYQRDSSLGGVLWGLGLLLIGMPVSLILLSAYLFPPLNAAGAIHFPIMWALLTLLLHALMVGWLIAEHYQWPWYVAMKISLQR